MTFQQLQYLLEVNRTGSFTTAAKNLFVTQSSVSNAITSLEKEYVATIKLGIKTDTEDITGNIIETNYNYKLTI